MNEVFSMIVLGITLLIGGAALFTILGCLFSHVGDVL